MARSPRLLLFGILVCMAAGPVVAGADEDQAPAATERTDGDAAHAPAPAAASASPVVTMDDLRKRLQERIAQVRATHAHAPAAASAPSAAASAPPQTQVAAPDLILNVGPPPVQAVRMPTQHRTASAAAARRKVRGDIHWSYQGEGAPEHWGELKSEYAACANGQRQSPIDIRDGIRVDLEPIQFDYRPVSFHVIDTGHTVQVDLAPGNSIVVGSRRYELLQFHFHRPSEEAINGRRYEMEAHLVHKDAEGHIAVIAVLMDQGRAHPMVQLVWNSLPLERDETVLAPVPIDMNLMLPQDRRYYTYMGSLTTPPCTEGVRWLVMKQPAMLSSDQISIFTRLYPMNARPVQQAAGRLIKESN